MRVAAKIAATLIFLAVVFAGVPWLIAISGQWDLYYTLTSVALLSIASVTPEQASATTNGRCSWP